MNKKVLVSSILLLLVAFSWGVSYAIVKDALTYVPPFYMLVVRFGVASAVLMVIYAKNLKNLNMDYLKRGGIVGVIMALGYITSSFGLKYTTASKQAFLIGTSVLIVPFLSWAISKKKPDSYTFAGVTFAALGMGFLTIEPGITFNTGDMLSVLCAAVGACHIVSIAVLGGKLDPILLTIVQFVVAGAISTIFAVTTETVTFEAIMHVKLELAFLVFVCTVFTFCTLNSVQRNLTASSAAILLSTENVFGALFAFYYLNERMTLQMAVGCVIIFSAIIFQQVKPSFTKFKRKDVGYDSSN